MSKFTDYLAILARGVKDIDKVLEGNYNQLRSIAGALPAELQEVADARLESCRSCPFYSANASNMGVYKSNLNYNHCSICKCPDTKKVMAFNEDCAITLLNNSKLNDGTTIGSDFTPRWYKYVKQQN